MTGWVCSTSSYPPPWALDRLSIALGGFCAEGGSPSPWLNGQPSEGRSAPDDGVGMLNQFLSASMGPGPPLNRAGRLLR
jgi:hypothetical protein